MEEGKEVILTGLGALLLYLAIVFGLSALAAWLFFPLVNLELSFINVTRLSVISICIRILRKGLKGR